MFFTALALSLTSVQAFSQSTIGDLDISKINKTIQEITADVLKDTENIQSLDFSFGEETDLSKPSISANFTAKTNKTAWSTDNTDVIFNADLEITKSDDGSKARFEGKIEFALNSDIEKLFKYLANLSDDACDSNNQTNQVLIKICSDFFTGIRQADDFDQQLTTIVNLFTNSQTLVPAEIAKVSAALENETDEEKAEALARELRDLEELLEIGDSVVYTETSGPRTGIIEVDLDSLLSDEYFSKESRLSLVFTMNAGAVSASVVFNLEVDAQIYEFFEVTAAQYLAALEAGDENTKQDIKRIIVSLVGFIQNDLNGN